jgi:hypothetical protein
LGLLAVRQRRVAGDTARARAMLIPLASDGHSGPRGPKFAEVLDILGREGPTAALTRLDAVTAEENSERH